MFLLSDYRYTLPEELIAQEAVRPHHDARMIVIDKIKGEIKDESSFWNIDEYLGTDRVLFFNDSRVLASRVQLNNIEYTNGGNTGIIQDGEIFYLETKNQNTFGALVRPGNKFKIGAIFHIGEYSIEVLEMTDSGRLLGITGGSIESFLETHGALPLPPYIEYNKEKEKDYQTSFAKNNGSVAAPTASLHFTSELMEKIKNPKEYLTLHVGLGTFQGIKTTDVRDYAIHRENVSISIDIFDKIADIKASNKKIVAVGTTATRTLESLPYLWKKLDGEYKKGFNANTCKYWNNLTESVQDQDWIHSIEVNLELGTLNFETSIYITPGYIFQIIDDLVTNFHLGESSLLVLVSAFIGYEKTMKIYDYAVKNRYRFYSFGDGMYIRGK
ncbi:S-adenosylmethionine:tRNA ribosyltransferase-isomerase [Candidatus Gracilibacteria bacterium]|nr:S-adenosylmethionine:tRNA ribosyltransferase-isomerase [Candidatus Gracilibacteria bacterium]